ncbi:MAG TPA: hypothetical protein VFL57_10130 [Bryobacteraceae bacterium]|nr:hypothetical protein [Bryobacteraceae bacterium]
MRRWFIGSLIVVAALVAVASYALWRYSKRFEPFVREQAIRYLEQRFRSRVELGSLRISAPVASLWRIRQTALKVSGERLVLHYRNRTDLPPLVSLAKFEVESTLESLWKSPRRIHEVRLERLEINVPPKRERRPVGAVEAPPDPQTDRPSPIPGKPAVTTTPVLVEMIYAKDAALRIYPDDRERPPRVFDIHNLRLSGAGTGRALHYTATVANPRPQGIIDVSGEFGPWQTDDPGLTPLSGRYVFTNADLGVFRGIAGILQSTGRFAGVLRRLEVQGETRTPDFRLTGSGNAVPLRTEFRSVVDGTTGDTLLQPVRATLGRTGFVAKGGVVRKPGAKLRHVSLDIVMQKGQIEDLLRLAMRGQRTLMQGEINLRAKLEILPHDLATVERLLLEGNFDLDKTYFSAGGIQDKIDTLSRRAQGQPRNEQIADVLSAIRGAFRMRNGDIAFSGLKFRVPGAEIDLQGSYGLYSEAIDLRGTARLEARVSQTMTGWKRWVLKPVDPFFSKQGAGTFLPIRIDGTRTNPHFGLDRRKDGPAENATRARRS